MDPWIFLFVLLKSLIQYPQPVSDGLDEERRLRMEERAKYLELERIRLEQEMEQQDLEQVQLLQLLAVTVLVVLLMVLWFIGWKNSLRRERDEEEDNGANEEEFRNVHADEEEEGVGNEEDNANLQEDNNDDGPGQDVGNVAINEEDNVGNEDHNENGEDDNNDVVNVEQEAEADLDDDVGRVIMDRIQWPVQDLQEGCEWITGLMDNYAIYFGHVLANSFYPVLQRAIGVGSAFEGWSPREEEVVYSVLIPMTPPRGHSFHLEPESAEPRQVRNFRVRVQLECTCTGEQQGEDMLCFLHCPEEKLRSNQDPSLLDTLCTDSYLDVQKTARWFYQLVKAIWPALPQSHNWHLVLLPSRRSCEFKVTNGTQSFRIEMLFGVRRGDSHIFVSSQPREAYTQSTTWPETYAVAETEFFKYIARQAPPDSLHLRCLQFFTRLPVGLCFSTYAMKTIVMHLFVAIPVPHWRRRHFRDRLEDIIDCLRLCVFAKRLNHFIVGNRRLPGDIQIPADVQTAATYNLFHHLAQQPYDDIQVLDEYQLLRERYNRIIHDEN